MLVVVGGITTAIWDMWLRQQIGKIQAKRRMNRRVGNDEGAAEENRADSIALEEPSSSRAVDGLQRRNNANSSKEGVSTDRTEAQSSTPRDTQDRGDESTQEGVSSVTDTQTHRVSGKMGIAIIAGFFGESTHTREWRTYQKC